MRTLSLLVRKLWPRLKFSFTHTHGDGRAMALAPWTFVSARLKWTHLLMVIFVKNSWPKNIPIYSIVNMSVFLLSMAFQFGTLNLPQVNIKWFNPFTCTQDLSFSFLRLRSLKCSCVEIMWSHQTSVHMMLWTLILSSTELWHHYNIIRGQLQNGENRSRSTSFIGIFCLLQTF